MASWRGAIDIPAPEVHRLTAVLPLVFERLRGLDVRDGAVLDPWHGDEPLRLRVVDGVHPQVGARYEATLPDEHPWAAVVEADDARSVRVVVVDDVGSDDEVRLAVEVPMPARPTELRLEHLMAISSDGFMAGSVESDGTVSWEMLLQVATGGVHRFVTVSLGHPRFRAGVVADVAPSGDTWRLTADAFVTGRGMVRPLFALMMVFVGRKVRRVIDEHFADVVEWVQDWNDVVGEHRRDEELADALVDRWLDQFRPAR